MANIHPTAIIEPGAQLHETAVVEAYAIVRAHVKVGARTWIGPHAVVEGHTTIGEDNRIFQFASVGAVNQDKKYKGEPCELVIGDRNTIREFTTLNIGTVQGGGVTKIGSDNWLMAYTHIAHDCVLGNNITFANNAQLAGHVVVEDWVILGGFTNVHQFCHIGAHGMTALGTVLLANQPPFVMSDGRPAAARSMNFEGLRRRGFSPERISAVKAMHKILYREGLTLEQAIEKIRELPKKTPEAQPDVDLMLGFFERMPAERGIVR
ncbi:acyl-ACP--UDP-N-acetylglucosamine O-acyltransferase [Ramlibacter albus]|uniref:Acyl-[acyl-carrier-protein]--UDP-N-acetylglucosamine O-acyltransferase n=1 Tax=Ramlibacter albus TaxID=2079448 RepID=A0A923MBV2_9BURK|nr:acyl-ACP--UDP-N-acetylglucosamine O-acyltransferase [Ramlibacter albus]MBC5766661.1 acyl-ACP--UDP-N-acetylglucosamine O-acyltransferase [Ramlibacter albus]